MFRRAWKPLAASVAVGGSGYYFYRTAAGQTFEIPIKQRGPDGKTEMSTKTLSLISLKEADARIQERAVAEATARPDGFRWRYSTAALASNDPIEDAHANQIVERDPSDPSAPGDYLFFAVMDGHGGFSTSQLLSRILTKAVALELAQLVAGSQPPPPAKGFLARLASYVRSSPPVQAPKDANPTLVSQAIQDAFVKLDAELLQAPLRILANNIDKEGWANKTVPDLSKHPLALSSMLPAVSGIPFANVL